MSTEARRGYLHECSYPGCTNTHFGTLPREWYRQRSNAPGALTKRCPEHIIEPCSQCKRDMVPYQRRQDYPDRKLVRRGTGGLCIACEKRNRDVETVSPQQAAYVRRLARTRLSEQDFIWVMGALGIDVEG